ncbi:flagellar basal body P-ring formation chaperone FlgA [Vibrio ostreicida]|uniref:Flagella basal body P-ring formation protein FlgA n=1 Tax=Vibrio ostreicida TaxID=526588 RepID=A0ABT8BR86_9VIBR|nr:flagellar basal body P-ring formation chaperone FlgA [Vibrio ostreicida]MDN3609436.1 flagellar basal body P-ring formation chaperone FlgA [Vibrio ostreicida]NPD08319.1 flagellar basal body P-ring formation protein FlgA [Vibrio ostreicida]
MKSYTYKKERNVNFRKTEVGDIKRNTLTSSVFLWGAASLFFHVPAAFGSTNPMSQQAIHKTVAQDFEQEVKNQAETRLWGEYQLEYTIRVPTTANHLSKCPVALVVKGIDSQSLPVGNLKRSVSCLDSTTTWRLNVSIKSRITLNVVVALNGLNRGDAVTASVLALEERTFTRSQDFFTRISQALNNTAARRIRSGQVLDPKKLDALPMVNKGNQVVIVAAKDGFSATTRGVAMENGEQGQQIDVRNSASGKIIRAVVTDLNMVRTQF